MDIIISLNKPKDITSQDAVTKVKKILKVKKAGHTGTLDPMATGLMLVCVNRATRLASYFTGLDKEYKAVMKLGETTDTQDACGKIIEKVENIDVDKERIKDDPRFAFGLPRTDNGNYIWIQIFNSALNATGRAGFVMASSATDAGNSEKLIREKL